MRLLSALDRREGEAIQDGGRHWTIGNDLVKRTLSFDSKSGLVTQQFADLSTGIDLVTTGAAP